MQSLTSTHDRDDSVVQTRFGVVIPVHNEPRLALLLRRFDFTVTPHVIVVDDGSTDGSTEIAAQYPVVLLRHERRLGVGAAIRTGLLHLREQRFDVAVVMGGNNKDDPADIPILIEAIRAGHDYVQGSRYAAGATVRDMPLPRWLITRLLPFMWSIRFRRRFTEVTSGFRAYRLSILDHPAIRIGQSWLDRYELEHYLQYKVLQLGFRFTEAPVTKIYPKDGLSISKIRLFSNWDWWSLMRPFVLLTLRLKD
jgi:dolichol-phosphate mannosyltransferase